MVEGSDLQALSREELRLAIAIANFQEHAQTFKYKFEEVDPGFDARLATGEKRFFDVSIYSEGRSRPGIAVATSRVTATIVAADDQSIDSMLRYGPAKAAELSINDGWADHGYKDLCEQLAYSYGLPEGSWREVLTVLCDAPSYQEPRVKLPPMSQTLDEKLDMLLKHPQLSPGTRKSILEYQTRSPKTITSALAQLKEAKPHDDLLADCFEQIAKGLPAVEAYSKSGEYARGFRDALESLTYSLAESRVQPSAVLDAVETALDAYGNNVADDDDVLSNKAISALSQPTALERACEQPSLERPESADDTEDASTRMG